MSYFSFYDIFTILPEIYIFLAVCLILVVGVSVSTNVWLSSPLFTQSCLLLSSQTLIFGILLNLFSPLFLMFSWNHFLICDIYSYKLKTFVLLISLKWTMLASFYITKERITSFEYWTLSLLSVLAISFVLQVNDLLSMYLAIEFQSLIFYILTSYKRTSEFSTEAGLKYFVLGAFSSSLLLFGSSILYTLTALTNFTDLEKFVTGFTNNNAFITNGILTSLFFILVSLLFKIGSAPFHMWSPDVYEGAPTATTAFLTILPKISLVILTWRLFTNIFQTYLLVTGKLLLASGIISLIVGAFGALSQKKWKRFIAYSSINHIGFILLSLCTGVKLGIFAILFYLVIYLITMLNAFSWIVSFRSKTYLSDYQIRYLSSFCSLGVINPILTLTLTLVLFSMAGVPPLAGFFSKMFILFNLLQNKMYGAAVIAIILSCLACFYYIRIIKLVYFSHSHRLTILYPINWSNSIVLAVTLSVLVLVCLDLELIALFLENILVYA